MSTHERDYEQEATDKLLPEYTKWVKGNLRLGGNQATAVLSLAFVAVSGLWYVAARDPLANLPLLQKLQLNFQLDASDLAAGRPHCLVTHAFFWPGELWYGLLMAGGLLFFGSSAERRLGPWGTLLLFLGATATSAGLMLWVHDPARAGGLPGWLRTAQPWPFCGPAAGVTALLVAALLARPARRGQGADFLLVVGAGAFVLVDCTGLLRTDGQGLGAAARVAGALVGAAFGLLTWLGALRPGRAC